MTGLNSLENRSDPWDPRVDSIPEGGRFRHARHESTTSDTAMLDNSYDSEPTREMAPLPTFAPSTSHLNQPNQYDEYRDPYYHGAQRP